MIRYLIVGNGDYAKMLNRYLQRTTNISISGYTVPKDIIDKTTIDGIPVVPIEKIKDNFCPDKCKLFMGIGYRNMNQIKEKEYIKYKNLGYSFENYIHPTAIIENNVILGEGNNIFEGVIIQDSTVIGNVNLIYAGVMIAHETIVGNYNSFSANSCIAGCARIGNNCFLGANSTIRDHISLSDYTFVGASAYVEKNTNLYDVIVPSKSMILKGKSRELSLCQR